MLLSIYAYLICNYFFHKIKRIDAKILLLLLACFFLQASQLSLATHDGNYDTCFYSSISKIFKNGKFNYTITQSWNADRPPSSRTKRWTLLISSMCKAGRRTRRQAHSSLKQARKDRLFNGKSNPSKTSPKPQTPLSSALPPTLTSSSLSALLRRPSSTRCFQERQCWLCGSKQRSGSPFIGKWSVLVDLVEDDEIAIGMKIQSTRLRRLVASTRLTLKTWPVRSK